MLIDRETINLTPPPCGFDPYLLSYYAMLCTCDITIEGRKVPIKDPQGTFHYKSCTNESILYQSQPCGLQDQPIT